MIEIPISKILTLGMLPSFLKCFYYRFKGVTIGTGVHFSLGSVLSAKEIRIGDGSRFGFFSIMVAEKIEVGKRVHIGSFTFLSAREISIGNDSVIHELVFSGILDSPKSVLHIGNRVRIFPLTVINPTMGVTIEDEVGIGGYSLIFTHGVWQSVLQGYPVQYGSVAIRKGAWLPWKVFVLPGVTIGEGATIGAGSLVTSDVPPRSLAFGVPSRVAKSGDDYPKFLSLEEKENILASIFKDYAEYASYKGRRVRFEARGDRLALVVGYPDRPEALIKYLRPTDDINSQPAGLIVPVYLSRIDTDCRRRLEERSMAWIDLHDETRSNRTSSIIEEFADFLFRYGIRAKKVEEL